MMREIIKDKKTGRILWTLPKPMPTLDELLENTIPVPFSGCLLWLGSYATEHRYPVIIRQRKRWQVTRLVLEASLGRRLEKQEFACHKCDVPLCINPEHLFAGTNRDNQIDARNKGTLFGTRGSKRPQAKLTETDIPKIRELLNQRKSQTEIGKIFGISQSQVSTIKTGRRNAWNHVK